MDNVYVNEGVPSWEGIPSLKITCKQMHDLRMNELEENVNEWLHTFDMRHNGNQQVTPQIFFSLKAYAYQLYKESNESYILFGLCYVPVINSRSLEIGAVCEGRFDYIMRLCTVNCDEHGIYTYHALHTPTLEIE